MSRTAKIDNRHKALRINLDPKIFGTVARTISVYDMMVSDALYGDGFRAQPRREQRAPRLAADPLPVAQRLARTVAPPARGGLS